MRDTMPAISRREEPAMQEVVEDFRRTIERAAERLLRITEEQSRLRPSAEKWSPIEIVGHLVDSAANNHQRFVRAQFTDNLVFPGYEQEDWVRVQGYREHSWPLLVGLWRAYNLHLSHLISRLPEDVLKKLRAEHNLDEIAWRTVGRGEPVTLDYFIRDYIGHLKHHLRQVLDEEDAV